MGDLARPRLLSAWQTLDTPAGALLVRRAVNGGYPVQARTFPDNEKTITASVWAYGAPVGKSPVVVPVPCLPLVVRWQGWELP